MLGPSAVGVVKLRIEARTATLYGVGGGKALFTAILDLPSSSVEEKGLRIPFIPGSTVKGWLREAAVLTEEAMGISGCGRRTAPSHIVGVESIPLCPSHLLLGAPYYSDPALLHVTGLRAVEPGFTLLYHNSLRKSTLAIEAKHLFKEEHFPPGIVFQGMLKLHPITSIEKCATSSGLVKECGLRLYRRGDREGWDSGEPPVDPPVWLLRFLLAALLVARALGSGRRGGILDLRVTNIEVEGPSEVSSAYKGDPVVSSLSEQLRSWRWE